MQDMLQNPGLTDQLTGVMQGWQQNNPQAYQQVADQASQAWQQYGPSLMSKWQGGMPNQWRGWPQLAQRLGNMFANPQEQGRVHTQPAGGTPTEQPLNATDQYGASWSTPFAGVSPGVIGNIQAHPGDAARWFGATEGERQAQMAQGDVAGVPRPPGVQEPPPGYQRGVGWVGPGAQPSVPQVGAGNASQAPGLTGAAAGLPGVASAAQPGQGNKQGPTGNTTLGVK